MATATSAGGSPTFLQEGYKLVYKKPCITTLSPNSNEQIQNRNVSNLNSNGYQQVPDRNIYVKIGNGSDRRMRPPPGSVPTADLRYSMYVVTSASDSGNTEAIDRSVSSFTATQGFLPIPILSVSFQRSSIVFCNTFFEAQEYIDLPISSLTKVYGQAVQNPTGAEKQYTAPLQYLETSNPIFKVIHLGKDKLIPDDSTKDITYWMSVAPYISGNKANGTSLTDHATYDVRKGFEQRTLNTDTASRMIQCSGLGSKSYNANLSNQETNATEDANIGYVSYIGMTKPIFRDIVMTSASTSETGIAVMGSFISQPYLGGSGPTPISSPQARILRFAWVNMGTEETPSYEWRLSESFGIAKALSNIQQTPAGVEKKASAEPIEHYVYDLKDDTYPEWTGFYPGLKIFKKGYEVNYALAKMDAQSPFYDANFSAKILEQSTIAEPVYGPAGAVVLVSNNVNFYSEEATTLLTGYNAVCGISALVASGTGAWLSSGTTGSSIKKHTYVYTSPKFLTSFGSNARMGTEYSCMLNQNTLLETSDAAFLIRSAKAPTISSTYDPCLASASVFDIAVMDNYTSVVERSVDDDRWARSLYTPPPKSAYSYFMLGEYPYRSEGILVLLPKTELLEMNTSDGAFSIPSGKIVTLVQMNVEKFADTEGTFKFYPTSNPQGTPTWEFSLGEISANASGFMNIYVPSKRFASYSAGGGVKSLNGAFGCDANAVIAKTLTPYEMKDLRESQEKLAKYSDAQVKNIPELKFPVAVTGVTAASDCISGYSILAYETQSRIDLAVRSAHFGPFIPVRDIILRVPNDDSEDGKSLPDAARPVLMTDYNTKSIYLFYVYKSSLVVKEIPEELIKNLIGTSKDFSAQPEKEAEAIKRIHLLNSSVVYRSDPDDASIENDLVSGSLKYYLDVEVALGQELINEYCVFMDQVGYLYAAIQTTNQIYILRSYNGGELWENLLPQGFSFYPPKRVREGNVITIEQQEPVATDAAIPQYPYVMVDWQSQTAMFFYFVEDNLLVFDVPVEVFRESKKELPDILSPFINPKVIVGKLTDDMIQRGIYYGDAELVIKSPPVKAIPQKVTGVITKNGACRVFFRDSNGFLKSTISMGLGGAWALEEDYKVQE